jgi:hypothetical protein
MKAPIGQSGALPVARGSEPSGKQAERSGKRGCESGSPHLPSVPLSAVASRLRDKPSTAESGGVGATAPIFDSRILKLGYTSAATRESTSARRLAERQRRAGVWGQLPQLLSHVGAHTNAHRSFHSAEHLLGRAPANDAAGQAPKSTARCGCSLGAAGAKRRTPVDF